MVSVVESWDDGGEDCGGEGRGGEHRNGLCADLCVDVAARLKGIGTLCAQDTPTQSDGWNGLSAADGQRPAHHL